MNDEHHTKLAIVGSGPAGYTAAIYGARALLKPIVFQGNQPGGQLTITTEVENYPGFPHGVKGASLMMLMRKQAESVGAKVLSEHVVEIGVDDRPFRIRTEEGHTYHAESVIISTGARAKWLGLNSESSFRGYGVSACATCDGYFFRDKRVMVVGGGNTAIEEALFLTKFASRVFLVHRRDKFRAEKVLQQRLFENPKVEVIWDTKVDDIFGFESPKRVTYVVLKNLKSGASQKLDVDGLFVAIGHSPETELVEGKLELNASGYIVTAPDSTATSVRGIFAAGDVCDEVFRQAVTAAGQGCMAALEAERFLCE